MKTVKTETPPGIRRVEALVCEQPFVRACVAVGEGQPYYALLISADKAGLIDKLREQNPNFNCNLDSYQGMNSIEVRSYYCDLLERVNKHLEDKRIERFVLLDFDSSKPREIISTENRAIIESFYQEYIAGVG